MTWRQWLDGLIGGAINSAAGGVIFLMAGFANDPTTGTISYERLGGACLGLALLGAALWLRQHPTPSWDGTERRAQPSGGGQ